MILRVTMYLAIIATALIPATTARGESTLLTSASGTDDTSPTSLKDAAAKATEQLAQPATRFRISLLDKSAEALFPDIDCQDGSDLLYRWGVQGAEQVTEAHIQNAAAFRDWFTAQCSGTAQQ